MAKLQIESQKNPNTVLTDSKTIFLLSCSPRDRGHTFELIRNAECSLAELPTLSIQLDTFAGKKVNACQNCFDRCVQDGHCWQDDDFNTLAEQWLNSDGVIIGSPVYTFGPPAPLYAFFERLQSLQRANPGFYVSRNWPQPVGIIAQGGSEYGGVEVCAQSLFSLCLQVGCFPISGDMPGFSQGVIGQITDDGSIPERMVEGVRRLALRVYEFVEILAAGQNPDPSLLRFLIASCGDKRAVESFSKRLMDTSEELDLPNVSIDWRQFNFNNKHIAPCLGCTQLCSRDQECCFHDDMQEFRHEWLSADGIFWLIAEENNCSLSQIQAAIDRMNQVRFETHFASNYQHMPRYLKVAIPLVAAANIEGLTSLLTIRHISLLYQNVLLPGFRYRQRKFRPGMKPLKDFQSAEILDDIKVILERSVLLAQMLKSGISRLKPFLPVEYYPSHSNFAKISPDAEINRNLT